MSNKSPSIITSVLIATGIVALLLAIIALITLLAHVFSPDILISAVVVIAAIAYVAVFVHDYRNG